MFPTMHRPLSLLLASALTAIGAEPDASRDFNPRTVLKKAIPAITDAPVIDASKVTDEVVQDNELIIGVVHNGKARAYPVNQLTGPSREIINDHLGGGPLAATW